MYEEGRIKHSVQIQWESKLYIPIPVFWSLEDI